MEEKNQLRWFLIKNFIIILVLVGIAERMVMELLNQLIIPVVQKYYFANNTWNRSLPTWQIILVILSFLIELFLLGVKSVLPAVASSSVQVVIESIENEMIKIVPGLHENRSVTQIGTVQGILLLLIIFAMIVLILTPYAIAAVYFTVIVSKEVHKITEHEKEIHERYDKGRNLMLSDIAHDLRTPITTVAGYAKAIQDGMITDPEKLNEYLTVIQTKSMRLNELINLLFEYVKLDSEGFSLDKKPVNIIELLRENAALMYTDVEDAGMHLNIELPEEEWEISADKIQISRVITNLLTNAIRHNEPGTDILVAAECEAGCVCVVVADNGKPIPPVVAEHLFEPFAVGDESRNSRGGSGLGLSIAAKIVSMHGWRLELKEYPGYTKAFIMNVTGAIRTQRGTERVE